MKTEQIIDILIEYFGTREELIDKELVNSYKAQILEYLQQQKRMCVLGREMVEKMFENAKKELIK